MLTGDKVCFGSKTLGWHTYEYYTYCNNLIENILQGHYKSRSDCLKVDIQCEHTLVKANTVPQKNKHIVGNIKSIDDNSNYLIRIPHFEYYNALDLIIEYSLPNIINIKSNDIFNEFVNKIAYIAPIIYATGRTVDYDFTAKNNSIFTIFSSNPSANRELFEQETSELSISNITNIFDKQALKQVYNKYGILINLHQTYEHHTFEELRCLPALVNGVIVISEEVPLKHTIPYSEHIIWTPRNKIKEKILEVQRNYNFYHNLIFTDKLKSIIDNLIKINYNNLDNILRSQI